jgi:hypothetical protein
MAKEIVVTSVPRGIELGRTGFQVVMRTSGISEDVMSSLRQLADYRHVHPQGSGRNPVIYSYRTVRGNTGQHCLLGRTVDAGNDFSNRSNKLAHLLAVDQDELAGLRNSSPAAVLAAIDGRLATVWSSGPEERVVPFALPAPLVQAAVCQRWDRVTGDAGWGGVLAQRALRGQPSLVIAPDCSPAWCRTLLELFQEVLALLPADNRWRTTFDTTAIGGSSSLLRGTYAGSPESAKGYAGLLVVDLSSRIPVPANMATDDLVSVARQGPKQSVARGPSRAPSLPPPMGEALSPAGEAASPMPVGQPRVGSPQPPKAPVDWDDDEPRPRLQWYILGGLLLAAVALSAFVLAASYWRDAMATVSCERRISAYADADGSSPPDSAPTLEEWRRAFRDDRNPPTEADFPLLLSALRTKGVGSSEIASAAQRSKLLSAIRGVLEGKGVLEHAATLGVGVALPGNADARAAMEMLLTGWIASRATQPKISDVKTLQEAIDAATQVVLAASDTKDGTRRRKLSADSVDFLWPGRLPPEKRSDILNTFRDRLSPKEAGLTYKNGADTLEKAIKDVAEADRKSSTLLAADSGTKVGVPSGPPPEASASAAFNTLRNELAAYQPKPVAHLTAGPVTLASGLDAENLTFDLSLPSCDTWTPKVDLQSDQPSGQQTWKLKGLPNDPETEWGTVTLDKKKNELTFASELGADGPQDHLYVPLKFSTTSVQNPKSIVLPSLATAEQVVPKPVNGNGCSLYDVLTGEPISLTTDEPLRVASSLLGPPNLLELKLNSPHSNELPGFCLETRVSQGPQARTTDLWVDIATGDPPAHRRVWLESLSGELEADGDGIRIRLLRSPSSSAWTNRPTRFGDRKQWPPLSVAWNRDKFVRLVKEVLDDHVPDPRNTIDSLEKRIDHCIELKRSDEKMKLDGWRERTFQFVAAHNEPFHDFVRKRFEEEPLDGAKRGPRPQSPILPKEPDPKADDVAKAQYAKELEGYRREKARIDAACEQWDRNLETRLRSSLWLTRFLEEAMGDEDPADRDARDFVVALLGIDAWLALDGRKDEMQKECREISLDRIVTANLELLWKWPPVGVPIRVKRFDIKPPQKRPEGRQPGTTSL